MSSYYNAPRAMNVGGMDLLNFLDIRDKELDPTGIYDDLKEPKHGMDSCGRDGGDMDDLGDLVRKESRIPVAIRRLRSRTDRSNSLMPMQDGQITAHTPRMTGTDNKLDDWQGTWSSALAGDKDNDCVKKISRMHRRKPTAVNQLSLSAGTNGQVRNMGCSGVTGSSQQFMCPKCGRSCVMINRDGVYVAFSVGVTPLVLLCLFFVCVLFGWLGLGYGVGPAVLRRLRHPTPERQRPRGGWIGRLFNKEQHY